MIETTIHDVKEIKINKTEKRYLNEVEQINPYCIRTMRVVCKGGSIMNFNLFADTENELEINK